MDSVPPVIEPMQVDYEDIENGDDNIAELPLVEPPANEENHADFQVQGPTNLDLDSFLNLYEGKSSICPHRLQDFTFRKYPTGAATICCGSLRPATNRSINPRDPGGEENVKHRRVCRSLRKASATWRVRTRRANG